MTELKTVVRLRCKERGFICPDRRKWLYERCGQTVVKKTSLEVLFTKLNLDRPAIRLLSRRNLWWWHKSQVSPSNLTMSPSAVDVCST